MSATPIKDPTLGSRVVWIVNHYAIDPAQSASGSRHFSLARRLAELGWVPVILAASTDHPSGVQRQGIHAAVTDQEREGVTFRYLRAPSYRSGIGRLLNILVFTCRLLLPSARQGLPRPEVIIGSTVHPLAAYAASILARRARAHFVFEVRDLWPQTLIDMGKLGERSLSARLMRRMERALCDRSDAIITLFPFAHEYFESQGIPASKVFWVSNGTDLDAFSASPAGTGDPFTIMYLGSIGRANGVDMILEAFLDASEINPALRLVIVGKGAERAQLEARAAASTRGDRVRFRDPVVKAEVPRTIGEADSLVINILDLDVYRYGVSMNKLFDYAAAARPILIASNARNNFVADADAGIAVPAGDVAALSIAMQRIAVPDLSTERARWGSNARNHVAEHYDYRVLGGRLHELLMSIIEDTA